MKQPGIESHNRSNEKEQSFRMFNRIHKRYDFLNRFFSFGQDTVWRKRLRRWLNPGSGQLLLDLAAGTGDVAFSLLKHTEPGKITRAFGCDMAFNMLQTAKLKGVKKKMEPRVSFLQGDAGHLPFGDKKFNAVTMAFGIRNVPDPLHVLKEIRRVLDNEGKALILEFSLPKNRVIRWFHLFYLRFVIPVAGAIVSGDRRAYRYLNQTIETFPYGTEFCKLMESAGFRNVCFHPLTFGVATVYEGVK